MAHYLITILSVVVLVCFQFKFFLQLKQQLKLYMNIFNGSNDIILESEDGINIISFKPNRSPIFKTIIDTLNGYLMENEGAASDFHLMKDVVDRNCDSVEEEIATLTPMPLYFGLIGTMIGILVGVGLLVLTGGLDSLLGVDTLQGGADAGGGIVQLLGGVAIAMVSSIMGIGLTTYGSYLNKSAKSKLTADKNAFFSWIQVKLLPSLGGDAKSAMHELQRNLAIFNKTFSDNITGLNDAFGSVGNSCKDQLELMTILKNMDVSQMATANVQVLKELQKSTVEFERFNQYMNNVTMYLEKVEALNNGVNEHLNRTHAIEKMGEFFQAEVLQIEERKGVINSAVSDIDRTLMKTLDELNENANIQLNHFIERSVELQDKFSKAIERQRDEANSYSKEQQNKFNIAIDVQAKAMEARLSESNAIIDEIRGLGELKACMQSVVEETKTQNNKLDSLVKAISASCNFSAPVESTCNNRNIDIEEKVDRFSIVKNIAIVAACFIVSSAAIFYLGKEFQKESKPVHVVSENNTGTSNGITDNSQM